MIKQKAIFLLLSISVLISCKPPIDEKQAAEKEEQSPIEWLTFAVKKELQKGKNIVLVSGDEEYRSEEALPQLAKILSTHHGFDCTVLFSQDPALPGIADPNYSSNIPGLNALENADLVILFTRFRALPDDQMKFFENYLMKGKPIIGVRTATHAFNYQDTTHLWKHWGNYYNGEKESWNGGFGEKILGAKWHWHHGHHRHQSTRGVFAEGVEGDPLLNGIENGKLWGATDVYGMPLPLPGDARPIILGQVIDRTGEYNEADLFYGMKPNDNQIATTSPARKNKDENPNEPMMPVVWTKSYQLEGGEKGMALTSTLGASADLMNEELRRLFVNAAYHLTDLKVPEKADVNLVGKFNPSQFKFHDDEYWKERNIKIADLLQ